MSVNPRGLVAAAVDLSLNHELPHRWAKGAGDDAEKEGEKGELGWEAPWGRGKTMSACLGNARSGVDDEGGASSFCHGVALFTTGYW